jgi:hypothetical protein
MTTLQRETVTVKGKTDQISEKFKTGDVLLLCNNKVALEVGMERLIDAR